MSFEFQIVDIQKASKLRELFIDRFIDTKHELYQEHIEMLHAYPDGEFYNGYLWEFLLEQQRTECDMESACEFLGKQGCTYVMWDWFSNHRVFDKSKFSRDYAKNTIIEASAGSIAKMLPMEWGDWSDKSECWFPEDIYCFDDTMNWCVVFTHEGWDSFSRPELKEDDYIRICFLCMNS